MQRVMDQVDAAYLKQVPPRPLPYVVVLNLMGDHIFANPRQVFLSPILIVSLVVLCALVLMRAPQALVLVPVLVLLAWTAVGSYRVWRRVSDDLALLQKGLIVRAHILKLRPHRTLNGDIDGALLDCAIPVTPRRTYVGSIWVSDGNEALRLAHQGRLEVVCLPRTPGTWRVLEEVRAEVRYERMGTMPQIPTDL